MDQATFEQKLDQKKSQLTAIDHPALRRLMLTCDSEQAYDLNRFLVQDCGLRFAIATGIDTGRTYEVLYHYSNDDSGTVVTLKAVIHDHQQPQIPSISPLLPGALWIEREIHDLLGIDFPGHPNLKRLILADDWPQGVHPLRKEFNDAKVTQ